MKKRKYIISFSILIVMGFLFLHSELDLFTPEQHLHTAHDFCDVVEGAKTENNSLNKSGLLFIFTDNLFVQTYNRFLTDSRISVIIQKEIKLQTNLNVLYSTFLI